MAAPLSPAYRVPGWLASPLARWSVLVLFWLLTATLTWRIVENPLAEYPNKMYATERTVAGDVLYKNIQTPYPPLAFWFYGLVMRVFPDRYAAVAAVSLLAALLSLIANYKVAALLHRKADAVGIAVTAYLLTFILTTISEQNFITGGYLHIGYPLATWFAWATLIAVRAPRWRWGPVLLAGVSGGLCLLIKHERVAAVILTLACLVAARLFLARPRINGRALSGIIVVASAVAIAGYGWVIGRVGFFYLHAALTNYGTLDGFMLQNLPSLAPVLVQVALALSCLAFFFFAGWRVMRRGGVRPSWPFRLPGMVLVAGTCLALGWGLVLEHGYLTYLQVQGFDLRTVPYLTQSQTLYYQLSTPDTSPLLGTLKYVAGRCLQNILPAFLLIAVMGLSILALAIRRWRGWQTSLPQWAFVALVLLAASAGLEGRNLLRRTEYGLFCLLLPVIVFMIPRWTLACLRVRPSPSLLQGLRTWYNRIFLVGAAVVAAALYLFEFRDARIHPLRIETDKGVILVPDNAKTHALTGVIELIRTRYQAYRVIVVPFDGMQYWTGGRLTPFSWAGSTFMPEFYHPPWSDELTRELAVPTNDFVFVELMENEVSVQGNLAGGWVSWVDGPYYRMDRWKDNFPLLWGYITNYHRVTAAFGPTEKPFYRVWTPVAGGGQTSD